MKKLVLTFASMLLISVMAATAQDTTKTSTTTESSQAVGKKDLVRVENSEVPADLKKTLEDPMYKGWENGTIWRNKTNDEYSVTIMSGTAAKTYRFDKNGKPIIDDRK